MMYKLEVGHHGLVVTNMDTREIIMVVDAKDFIHKAEQLRLRKPGDGMPKEEFVYHLVPPQMVA